MYRMREDGVVPQEMVVIVHARIGYWLDGKMSEKLLGLLNLGGVL